jgi:hypothetical protein
MIAYEKGDWPEVENLSQALAIDEIELYQKYQYAIQQGVSVLAMIS